MALPTIAASMQQAEDRIKNWCLAGWSAYAVIILALAMRSLRGCYVWVTRAAWLNTSGQINLAKLI